MAKIKAMALTVDTEDDQELVKVAGAIVQAAAPMYQGRPRPHKEERESPKALPHHVETE